MIVLLTFERWPKETKEVKKIVNCLGAGLLRCTLFFRVLSFLSANPSCVRPVRRGRPKSEAPSEDTFRARMEPEFGVVTAIAESLHATGVAAVHGFVFRVPE